MKYLFILLIFYSCDCKHTVKKVIDADTIVIENGVHIRLEGADAVELHQTLGYEAKAFAESYLLNKEVEIIPKEHDIYGRTVAKVIVDGQDFADILVQNGYACAYRRYCSDKIWNEYQCAIKERRGLFAYYNWQTPKEFRLTHKKKTT